MKSALLFPLLLTLALSSCTESPETVGETIAEKECECRDSFKQRAYPKLVEANEKILADLNANKFKTQDDFHKNRNAYFGDLDKRSDAEFRACKAEVEKMRVEAISKIEAPAERRSYMQTYRSQYEACSNSEVGAEDWKEIIRLEDEVEQIAYKLPRAGR